MDTNNNNNYNNYSSYYQQQRSVQQPAPTPSQPSKSPKKKGGTAKKVLAGTLIGLSFGIFAGVGFQLVNAASSIVKSKVDGKIVIEKSIGNGGKSVTATIDSIEGSIDDMLNGSSEKGEDEKAFAFLEDKEPEDDSDSSSAIQDTQLTPGTVLTTVTDVTEVVKNVMPSVVSVSNKYVAKMNYFGQTFKQQAESAGSGIIVGQSDQELLLVSNYHVVADADELTVTFVDGSQVPSQIKGTDPDKDLAVIAVQLKDISIDTMKAIAVAQLGDSDILTVGEPVVAIGNALGYGQSVTTGVVSALHREISTPNTNQFADVEETSEFIQTDAAINPGNSGGALLNIRGQVIGINSNKIGGSSVEGMGYAIPISDAKPIIEELMNKQTRIKISESERGVLGISGVNVEREYYEIYGLPMGVYISSVSDGSGAASAGLVKGDIIVGLNDVEIESMDDLKKELAYYKAGDSVELTIMQSFPSGYQSKKVTVVLSPSK